MDFVLGSIVIFIFVVVVVDVVVAISHVALKKLIPQDINTVGDHAYKIVSRIVSFVYT